MNQAMLPNMLAANPTRNLNEFNMASTPGVLLHIGNLHKEVSDAKLTEVFLKYGTVLAIRVVRDIMSKQSRGFGFVTMANQAEAEQARTHLNHERILGKEIIVSLFKKPNASDLDPRANLIIKNLDKHVGGRDLEKLCSEFGTVVTCRVKDDEEGNSIGYGYVQFEKEQEAEDCLNRIGQRLFFERLVTAERFAPLAKRNNTNQRSNLYIKHFPDNMTQNDVDSFITTHFEQFGAINSKGIYVDEKKNKIYSFVAFESPESAAKAIEQMNDHLFENGDKLYVGFAQTKVQRKQNFEKNFGRSANETNLFIRSLKSTVKDEDVKKVFSKFGPISSVATRSKEFPGTVGSFEKKVLGSAFINFLEASHASSAYKQGKTDPEVLDLLDSGVDKSIDFLFFSQPKELREQFLKTQQKKPSKPDDMTSMLSNPQFLMMFMKYMQENGNNQNQTRKPRTEGSGNSYNNYGANSSHPRRNNNRNQYNNNQTQGAPFMGQQQFGNNQMGKQMMNQQVGCFYSDE